MQSLPAAHPAQEMLRQVLLAGERLAELTRRMLAYAGKGYFRVEPTNVDQLVRDACESVRASIPETVRLEIRSSPAVPPVKDVYKRQSRFRPLPARRPGRPVYPRYLLRAPRA